MTTTEFNEYLSGQMEVVKSRLGMKAAEYAGGADRLHNFKKAGRRRDKTPAQALDGMVLKHEISISDKIEGGTVPTKEFTQEKLLDNIAYLFLLDAIWEEEREDL